MGSAGPEDEAGIDIRARLTLALRQALKRRDPMAVSAFRSALSAIGNAEAVDADREIVRAEISERLAAAGQYEQAGHADRGARLRDEAQVLKSAVWADR